MTIEDITRIETALGIKLPLYYISYVLDFPEVLIAIHQTFESDRCSHFSNNADYLIELNQLLGFHKEHQFIKQRFCIGENGGGDYYLIDLADIRNENIYFFDHEESVEEHYNETTDTWNWDALITNRNLDEYKISLIEIFGDPRSTV